MNRTRDFFASTQEIASLPVLLIPATLIPAQQRHGWGAARFNAALRASRESEQQTN
jgi:hypothetical protein